MRGLKRGIAAAAVVVLCLTSIQSDGLSSVFAAGIDKEIKLKPAKASTFHDTNEDGFGEFEGWGTSLCWWANRVGYDDTLTAAAAKAFFSDDGLDMNIGRYNVGGGDLVGIVSEVPVNEKAVFYDLETEGRKPEYFGSKMEVNTNTGMKDVAYSISDPDFGITKGTKVGDFKCVGWINKLGDSVGDGDNLHYTVNVKETGEYTVKLLLTLSGSNNRDVAVRVNGTDDYVVNKETINSNLAAAGNNNNLFVVTIPEVTLKAGDNTVNIAGKADWTLDFIKMAVIKSGEEGALSAENEFMHSAHITRSDSAVPGYAADVTKIDTKIHDINWYKENYARADEKCGYAWNYDWMADKNQINVLKAAASASGTDFIAEAFSNSPPYFMTSSGCSSGAVNSSMDNLRTDSYDAFAAYMADVIEHWNNEGVITFQSTTPMNEPYTSYWGANSNKQEGCHFDQGESQSKIIVALNKELEAKGINIIISGTDETSIDTAITSFNKLSDEAKMAVDRIDTHTYGGSNRSGLNALAKSEGKNLWMSEVDGSYTAGTSAGEMSAALGLAQAMTKDVNGLEAGAWIFWNAIDMHVDSKIGMSSDADYASLEDLYKKINMNSGYWGLAIADHDNKELVLTKKYYAYGQFSRYIRPGYTIIASSDSTLAAYDPEGKKVVVVAINTAGSDKTWQFDLSSFSAMGSNVQAVRTSGSLADGENWADVSGDTSIIADTEKKTVTATLKANSITTYTIDGVNYDSAAEEIVEIKTANVYTVEDVTAELPDTVQAVTNKNNILNKKVTWDLTDADLNSDAEVTGTVEGTTLKATAKVQVVSANMIYFIDCNNPGSTKYPAMNQYADLLNKTADQKYTEGGWGYLDDYGAYNGDANDEYGVGWYANAGQNIRYTVPLEAGEYKVYFGFREWWNDSNRQMTMTMIQGEVKSTLGTSSAWENGNPWNRDEYTITCEKSGDVTFAAEKISGKSDPVLSFIQIQKVLDLDAMKAAIKAAGEVDRTKYPFSRLAVLDKAVEAGRELLVKSSATQESVNAGAEEIQNAITALGEVLTEEELAENDYVLYLVNCGTSDTSVTPDGYKKGLYQSNVDQEYAADSDTGMSWGYEPNDENSLIVKGGSGANDITGSYIYMADSGVTFVKDVSGFKYKFELPQISNSDYEVTIGIKNPWSGRTVDFKLEGETVESGLNLPQNTLVERTYKVEVTDGELNVMVHNPARTDSYKDPVLSYITVKGVAAYTTDRITQAIAFYREAMEGHNYSETAKQAFEEAVKAGEALVTAQSTDGKAIKKALNDMEEAYNNLKEVFIYSSITGTNGAQLFDNNGNKIQAHGGQIQQLTVGGVTKYYWYGEDKTNGYRPVTGVHLYTSTDLYNWTDEGVVLKSIPVSDEDYGKDQDSGYVADLSVFEDDEYFKNLYGDYAGKDADDTANYKNKLEEVYWNLAEDRTVIERPKVLYNESTGKYVMWFHADGRTPTSSADYGKARAGVAISDSPAGPFKLLGTYKLHDSADADHSWDNAGGAVRDMNLFKDDDGQAYIIYSSDGNLTTYIAKLNASYTGLNVSSADAKEGTGKEAEEMSSYDYTRNFIGMSREAPAMFKYKGKYYIINSGCTGWNPNQANYAVADTPMGPWTTMGDPCIGDTSKTTFDTQSTCVFPVDAQTGKFIYMGDRWFNPDSGGDLSDSRYVWLPVEFLPGEKLQMASYADWTLDELDNKGSFDVTSELPSVVSSVADIAEIMPDTIMVDFGKGSVEKAVTWSTGILDEAKLGVATVTGTLTEGNREFKHSISIVNPKLIYFFDSGASTSEYYDTAAAGVQGRLKNTVPDTSYTEANGAGYLGVPDTENSTNFDIGLHNGSDYLSNGWWANGGKNIDYAFTLEPGTYTVSAGFQEWWNTTRAAKITISSETKTLAETDFTVYGTSTDLQINKTFEVTEVNAGKITVSISKTGNPDPVLSWIAVTHDDGSVDKTKLNTLITAAEALKSGNYTEESWNVLEQALSAGKTVAGTDEANQTTVDNAAKELEKAITDLKISSDKEELEKLAEEVEAFETVLYTAASADEYQAQINEPNTQAQNILMDDKAVVEDISSAYHALKLAFEIGKQKLVTIQSVLEEGIAVNSIPAEETAAYTQESLAVYSAALQAANTLSGSNDEEAVNQAVSSLKAAKDALLPAEGAVVDKTALNQAISQAPQSGAVYTAASWTKFSQAMTQAEIVNEDPQATQLSTDSALAALKVAQSKLMTLAQKVTQETGAYESSTLAPENYGEEAWNIYSQALADAKALADKTGVTESEIDAAVSMLDGAFKALTSQKTDSVDKEGLLAVLSEAALLKEEDYKKDAWTAFMEALKHAQELYDDKDLLQADVNKEIVDLSDAITELKKHPAETPTENTVDKSSLKLLIEEASKLKKDGYTGSSWTKFQTAFDNAANIYGSEKVTQQQVNEAAEALSMAMKALETVTPGPNQKPQAPADDGKDSVAGNPPTPTPAPQITPASTSGGNRTTGSATSGNAANTGDTSPIGVFSGAGIGALFLLVVLLKVMLDRKRKSMR